MQDFRFFVETLPQRLGEISQAFYFAEIDSTNLKAVELAQKGAPHATLVVAESQYAGRGRRGRTWESPSGQGLYFSLLLRPQDKVPLLSMLTLAVGLGLAEAVRALGLGSVYVKWPNDLNIGEKKLGGILTEANARGDCLDFIVVGVGLNVLAEAGHFTPEVAARATSFAQARARPWQREDILASALTGFWGAMRRLCEEDPAAFVQRWEQSSGMLGRSVVFAYEGKMYAGVVAGLDLQGRLLVRQASGETVKLMTEDVYAAGD